MNDKKIKLNLYSHLLEFLVKNRPYSTAQLSQDLFVLYFTKMKKNGFFVEIGAADGFFLSNTFLLENKQNWNGIVAEPLIGWHAKLKKNRNCRIDTRCVFNKSNLKLDFCDVYDYPEFSGLSNEIEKDNNSKLRERYNKIEVKTVSINDLFEDHKAPSYIDYISIDTEGSEYKILEQLNFNKYNVGIFTIEHNFMEQKRKKINNLLTKRNYIRVFERISKWDDWYIEQDNKILKEFFIN